MTSPRHLLLALLAAGACALVAPGIAGAASICVDAPLDTQCDDFEPDLQTALDEAQIRAGADTVLLGSTGGPAVGPFVYPRKEALELDPVTVKGVGVTRPTLTAPAGTDVVAANLITLERLDIQLPGDPAGIGASVSHATLRDVHVKGSGDGQGIRAEKGATLDDVRVSGTGERGVTFTDGNVHVSGLDVSDVLIGAVVGDTVQLQLERSRLSASATALSTRGSSSVSSSVIETTAPNGRGVQAGDGSVTLDHITVIHRGPVDGTDAALDFHPVDFSGQADVRSAVLAGYTRGIRRDTSDAGFTFPLTIRDSVWDNAHDVFVAAPNPGPFTELGNAHVDPKLVDLAGGDFRLRGSSAAVDRDSQTAAGYTDVDGAGVVDGDANGVARADAGALEYRRTAPSIDAADVPGAGAAGQALAFSAVASDSDGDRLQFVWDFGDGALGAGAQASHAFASPGPRTVVLHVTDEAGAETTRSFSVAITGDVAAAGAGGAGADVVAPKLSKVSLSKSKLSKSRLRARSAKAPALRFTLSERATVRITIGGAKLVRTLAPGRHALSLTNTLRKAKRLPLGRAAIKLTATDPAGNHAIPRTVKLKIVA